MTKMKVAFFSRAPGKEVYQCQEETVMYYEEESPSLINVSQLEIQLYSTCTNTKDTRLGR